MYIYHGTAIAKEDIGEIIKKGDDGIITAYLPEDNTFAVFFGDGKWYTFKDPEELFLNKFEIIQDPSKFINSNYMKNKVETNKDEITDKKLHISDVINSFSKKDFQKLANDFLVETEETDKNKMIWETKNHISILHQSLNEFYMWLEKNYW